jgi:hypothetical protein
MTHRQFFSIFISGVVVAKEVYARETRQENGCIAGENFHKSNNNEDDEKQ